MQPTEPFCLIAINSSTCSDQAKMPESSVFKGVKATNEQQDNGTGVLHQVAQLPVDQVFLYTAHPCPSPPTQNLERDKVLAPEQVGLYAPLTPTPPPHPAQRGSGNVWAVNNYQSLNGAWTV